MIAKLNLACGTDIRDGWFNLDIVRKWPSARRACDIIWDARVDRIPFPDGSVDEIYASYLLLHLAPKYHQPVLAEMYRVLAPSGHVTVGEVDMEVVLPRWLANPLDPGLNQLIWGEQGTIHGDEFADMDKHCQGFTEATLRGALAQAGFAHIERTRVHVAEVFYELTLTARKTVSG